MLQPNWQSQHEAWTLWPSGYGVGLLSRWGPPAQVRILQASLIFGKQCVFAPLEGVASEQQLLSSIRDVTAPLKNVFGWLIAHAVGSSLRPLP